MMDARESRESGTAGDEPSLSSSLERLVMASQGVVTKRIDLALLEAQDKIVRAGITVGLAVGGVTLAAAGWFALVIALVSIVSPDASLAGQALLFAAANAAAAVALLVPSARRGNVGPATRADEATRPL
jgi:uncharacterized membrane protein YqjE